MTASRIVPGGSIGVATFARVSDRIWQHQILRSEHRMSSLSDFFCDLLVESLSVNVRFRSQSLAAIAPGEPCTSTDLAASFLQCVCQVERYAGARIMLLHIEMHALVSTSLQILYARLAPRVFA